MVPAALLCFICRRASAVCSRSLTMASALKCCTAATGAMLGFDASRHKVAPFLLSFARSLCQALCPVLGAIAVTTFAGHVFERGCRDGWFTQIRLFYYLTNERV